MHNDFLSRFTELLGGRAAYTWGGTAGIGRGVINGIKNGVIPTGETLAAICRVENCSISWLLDGKGSPYLVGRCETDEECAEQLGELLEEKGWAIHLLTDGERYAIVLTQPASFFIKERPVEYTACETLAGPIAGETLAAVMQASEHHSTTLTRITPAQLTRLTAGEMGTFELLVKQGGLLNAEERLQPDSLTVHQGTREEGAGYNQEERQLLKAWRKLDAPLKAAALAAVEAMGNR